MHLLHLENDDILHCVEMTDKTDSEQYAWT